MYHLSVLAAKQHKIQLIVSSQISIPNVSPNLTDAHLGEFVCKAGHTFASIGVSAIGLMSISLDSGGRFLGNGYITVGVFQNFGGTPSRRELLNIDVTGPCSHQNYSRKQYKAYVIR